MRTLFTIPVLLFFLFLGTPSQSADFNKGRTAYEKGDFAIALKELKPLAEQGDVNAQFYVALMYDDGRGVSEDPKEAVRWYQLAAEQGYAYAQHNLGLMYSMGKGVIQDFVYAHMWSNIAASNGSGGAKENRELYEEKMSSSQIEEAQRLARECVKKNYIGC